MANISTEVVEDRIRQFGKLWTIDDIVRQRARDEVQVPILGYPKHKDNAAEYELFTGQELDRLVDEMCRVFLRAGLETNSYKTIALFAQSNLSFVVGLYALARLGCKVMMVSIRLGEPACLNLLKKTGCDTMIVGSTARISSTVEGLKKADPAIKFIPMPERSEFDRPDALAEPFIRPIADKEAEHIQPVVFGHSSGSTGLPKSIALSHRGLINNLYSGTGCKAFNALPLYHLHGLFTLTQAMYMRKTAYLFSADLPLTADNLVAALKTVQPEVCHCVPYALKLMAEREDGIEVLKRCKIVTSAGARTPDELGDRLVKEGVNLGVIFGMTETGHMGDSISREPGDNSWDYIRPYASLRPHINFKKISDGVYECVYLRSHPMLVPTTSNSDDPPGSFHSNDLYEPHPTIEHAWKYIARNDDTITLVSGEKIFPLGMEGAVRECSLVRDGLMVGNDRLVPGLLVFSSPAGAGLSDEAIISKIWPLIDSVNTNLMDEHARITRDMVKILPPDVEYPATDKNNIIRAASYRKFDDVIEKLYNKDSETNGHAQNLRLSLEELEKYVFDAVRDQGGIKVPDIEADFFAAGVDSLRASQLRRLLQQNLDLGGHTLPTNVVYDAGSVKKLAGRLYSLRTGEQLVNGHSSAMKDEIAQMQDLIHELGDFDKKEVVVLTGATGALGSHILDQLLTDPKVAKVYCLVRGSDPASRVSESLEERGLASLEKDTARGGKVVALSTSDFGASNLGLTTDDYATLKRSVTLVVHAAWPVNFNISLASFRPQIVGLRNFIDLAAASSRRSKPARVVFISSISTAFNHPSSGSVPESVLESLEYAANTGYARGKMVGEHLCDAAGRVGGVPTAVLRVGQIAADSINGIWNDKEHVPLLVHSAVELGCLPRLHGFEGRCEWMPVDTVAATVLQLADKLADDGGSDGHSVAAFYNVVPPHSFSWNEQFLPALRGAGLSFEDVEFPEWLARLRARGAVLGAAAETRLPAIKLADYYEDTYGSSAGGGYGSKLKYENARACADSTALRDCPELVEVAMVRKMLKYWLRNQKA